MPRDTSIGGKAVAEDVRPGADDLSLDALHVEPGAPLGHRLDQARKERPHLEPVIKMQRRRRAVRFNDANADLLAAGNDRVDQLRWDVMGMNVDWHAALQVQYVDRPPERSKTAPVLNEHSSDASQATSAATSCGSPSLPSGILDSM